MLSLARQHGEVLDFYSEGKHLLSITTMESDTGVLDIHQVSRYQEDQVTEIYNPEPILHVPEERKMMTLDKEHGIEVVFYTRQLMNSHKSLTMGIEAPSNVKIYRREVLIKRLKGGEDA
ncbi:hypothetical protein [Vibrio phage Va2]|nr:hypothetical protein [Vibrio phage Va2]